MYCWLKKFWNEHIWKETALRLLIVLIVPILIILFRSFLKSNIDTSLFVAIGFSNLITLYDIIKKFCPNNDQFNGGGKEEEFSKTLFFQLIVLSALIGLSFSFLFKDWEIKEDKLYASLVLGIVLLLSAIYPIIKQKLSSAIGLLFFAFVSFLIMPFVKYNDMPSQILGPPMHLIGIPLFFLGFDSFRCFVNKIAKAWSDFKLDIGLVLVGTTTFLTAKFSHESLTFFEAGSAAAILIIGNYFYVLTEES